jgi:hypothetical protein
MKHVMDVQVGAFRWPAYCAGYSVAGQIVDPARHQVLVKHSRHRQVQWQAFQSWKTMDVCRRQVRKEAFQLTVTVDRNIGTAYPWAYGHRKLHWEALKPWAQWSQTGTVASIPALNEHWPQSHSGKNSNPRNTAFHRITMTSFQGLYTKGTENYTKSTEVYSDKFSGPG